MHASEATAVGQALGNSEPVVVKIKETRLGLRLMLVLLLLEKMAHLEAVRRLLGTAAVGIWYERQLAVEILLLLLLLEWIHHVVAELLLLLALEGIWIVVEDGGCGGQRIQLASTLEGRNSGREGLTAAESIGHAVADVAVGGRGRLRGGLAGLQLPQLLVEILESGIPVLSGRHTGAAVLRRTSRMTILQRCT